MTACALALFCGLAPAQEGDRRGEKQAALPAHWLVPPAPVLSPAQEFKTFQLADDFLTVELFASEPMVQDPVAMDFDADGRLWVVEMRGFMPDIDGKGEDEPVGRVSILTDTDHDGRADQATVFIDKLVLPRALKVCWGGALVVADGKLWFARDTNGDGVADTKELVDADYIKSGNVEHQPNGLLLALDNWHYSAFSDDRYRRVNGVWVKEKTEYRGQWGITQDDFGRLYYNVNFSQLHGDPFPPNYSLRNPHFTPVHGINQQIATNQSVFTLRPNPGINRAYRPGVLDAHGHLREFTSAGAPLAERGGVLFTGEEATSLLVCEPAANLVKRNLVTHDGLVPASRFAYPDREFLASTDERFRPVGLANGPDGSLYIADMYRGISQHKEYMTTHLRKEVLARGLDQGIHLGRIWRVHHKERSAWPVHALSQLSPSELIGALRHPNGWVRDTAQRLIIERGEPSVIPGLLNIAAAGEARASIHALWSVEGLLAEAVASQSLAGTVSYPMLNPEDWRRVLALVDCDRPSVGTHAQRLAEKLSEADAAKKQELLGFLRRGLSRPVPADRHWNLQAALTLGSLELPESAALLTGLLVNHSAEPVIRDAVLSARPGRERLVLDSLLDANGFTQNVDGRDVTLQGLASAIIRRRDPVQVGALLDHIEAQRGERGWRRLALLNGFAENAAALRRDPLKLPAKPAVLDSLASTPDPIEQATLTAIRSGSAWPGHEPPRAVTAPLRPLRTAAVQHVERGRAIYRTACAACHGLDGAGLPNLGPPLIDSEWLQGPVQRIALIILHGMEGAIEVGGRRYEPPRILPNMPAVPTLSDLDVAAVASFVRREFGQRSDIMYGDTVTYLRAEHTRREAPWAPEELLKLSLPNITPKPEPEAQ